MRARPLFESYRGSLARSPRGDTVVRNDARGGTASVVGKS